MTNFDARTGIEWIDHDACLRLLASDEVGRLAVVTGSAPSIFVVNYVLDDETIVFRTAEGTKLRADGHTACFEIDEIDRAHRTGWSVIAAGRLEEVTRYDAEALKRVRELAVDPWAEGDKTHWMRLVPDRITGRRVRPRS